MLSRYTEKQCQEVRGMSSVIVAPLLARLDMPASRDSRDRRMEFSATGE